MFATRRYRVLTWDAERQQYTRQIGCPEVVEGIAGLRLAFTMLRGLGYECYKNHESNDPAVLIERIEE